MASLVNLAIFNPNKGSKSRLLTVLSFHKLLLPPFQWTLFHVNRPFSVKGKVAWSLRSSTDDGNQNSSSTDRSSNETRLIRCIKAILFKIISRLKELRKDLPVKLFSLLVGFYCATAFATLIGQTGDWDVLSAALAVAVVEGIGALMYGASLPLVDDLRNLIVMFNYWKAGFSLGLFLDSFKY